MNTVIKRVVCKNADMTEVTEWCRRIIGVQGWGTSVQLDSGKQYTLDPVILLYSNLDRPIEHIELMITLRWS